MSTMYLNLKNKLTYDSMIITLKKRSSWKFEYMSKWKCFPLNKEYI